MAVPSVVGSMLWNRTRVLGRPTLLLPKGDGRPLGGDLQVQVVRGELVFSRDLADGRFEGVVVVGQRRWRGALVRVSEDGREG
jgi:hypothetical protein